MTDTLDPLTTINDIARQGAPEANPIADARKRLGEAYQISSEVLGAVYETTVEAIKERPVAAAAVGIGVAATVAGAAYGATRMKAAQSKS
jgi:hypothetical protein